MKEEIAMKVIGDIRNANKFCVKHPEKGLLWVPSYEIAKQYANDPKNKNWYQQTIIATYEQIVTADDGKQYLKSQAPKKTPERQLQDNYAIFKTQSKRKIDVELENFAVQRGFDSFLILTSFSTSKLSQLKKWQKTRLPIVTRFINTLKLTLTSSKKGKLTL